MGSRCGDGGTISTTKGQADQVRMSELDEDLMMEYALQENGLKVTCAATECESRKNGDGRSEGM